MAIAEIRTSDRDSAVSASPAPTPPLISVRPVSIISVGGYVPEEVLTNADLEQMVDTSDAWILERTGIRQRHRAGSGETASEMGAKAARLALERAGNPEIDLIIAATCTSDTRFPSTACMLQRKLGLHGMAAMDVGGVCSGYIYAMAVANAMLQTGTHRRALVVATEALTTLVDWGDRATCVLFGDGAGATILEAGGESGVRATRLGADGGEGELIYFGPRADDPGSPDRIRMMGRGTYRMAVDRLCNMAVGLCGDAGWSIDEIDLFIPHQANQRIIEAAASRLGVPMEKVFVNIDKNGNTSAASIPLAMNDAFEQGRLTPGMKVVSVAFGAGATWGGIALQWTI